MLARQIELKTIWHDADESTSEEELEALDQFAFYEATSKAAEGITKGTLSCNVSRFDEKTLKETKVTYTGFFMVKQSQKVVDK